METLALLEERLLGYSGTVLLVSHDRAFLNNVVTSTLVFEEDGQLREYVGGYDDWLRQRRELTAQKEPKTVKTGEKPRRAVPLARLRLSFKETRELEELPEKIGALEEERTEIIAALSSSEFYARGDPANVIAANARLEVLALELDGMYRRWEELETVGD